MTSPPVSLLGAATPRVDLRPEAAYTFGPEACDLAAMAGIEPEPWQAEALNIALGVRADEKWACREYAEIVGRQQGKSIGIGLPRGFFSFLVLQDKLIIWSAHQYKTSQEAFLQGRDAIYRLGEDAGLNTVALEFGNETLLVKINNTNGEEGFELLNTKKRTLSRWRFVARSGTSGRGFSGDLNIIDEAFAYTKIHRRALGPTLLAKPNPQTVYLSSPPLDGVSGDVLFSLAARAKRKARNLGFRDWGLPVLLDEIEAMTPRERAEFLDDRAKWAAALPALGRGRVTEEAVQNLRDEFEGDDLGFATEVLCIWPKQVMSRGDVIDPDVWRDRADPQSRPGDALVFALDVSPGGKTAAIASSGRREDERLHVKIVDYRPGPGWVVDRIVELRDRWNPRKILMDPSGPAGALLADLQRVGVEVEFVTGREMAQACGALVNDLTEDRIRHCDQDALNDAVAQATSRRSADAWAWDRKDTTADICPLVACTAAAHGFRLYGAQEEVIPWAAWV